MHNYIYCSYLNVSKYLGSDEKRKRTELFAYGILISTILVRLEWSLAEGSS